MFECKDNDGNPFRIYEGPNLRNYRGAVDETKDKVYYLHAPNPHRVKTKDGLKWFEYIIKNKQISQAKFDECIICIKYLISLFDDWVEDEQNKTIFKEILINIENAIARYCESPVFKDKYNRVAK